MPTRFSIHITAVAIVGGLVLALLAAWRADRHDRAQLAADLATGRQALAQADARQHDRDAQLLQTLAGLAAEKRTVATPAQIIRELPKQIPLPAPIALQTVPCEPSQSASESPKLTPSTNNQPTPTTPASPCSSGPFFGPDGLDSAASTHSKPSAKPTEASAVIPAVDLKPLYDFTLDCRACQAKLAAAQADLTDERAKTTILTRERDEAVRVAKGGSVLRRIARNAKWLAIGAAAGAIAAKAHP
jgi:type II secretory pathway pseudopilin PulG